MVAHRLLVSHRQRYEYGLHKLTWGRRGQGWRNWVTASFLSDQSIAVVRGWDFQRASNVMWQEMLSAEISPPECGTGQGLLPYQRPGDWVREAVWVVHWWWGRAESWAGPVAGWVGGAVGEQRSLQLQLVDKWDFSLTERAREVHLEWRAWEEAAATNHTA